MKAPQYSSADFLGAIQALMPRGRVWPREPDALQTKVLAGLVQSYDAQTSRANNLLVDAFPASAVELLPEWEASLGLPSLAAGPNPSLQARQTLVLARLVGSYGVSVAGLVKYAAWFGYDITVTPAPLPFRCGRSQCGQALGSLEHMFGLSIVASSNAAMPFGSAGPAVLQDELSRIVAPTTVLTFHFP